MNSEKSILRFMKVYNINSPEGLQNKRSEDATLSVGNDQGDQSTSYPLNVQDVPLGQDNTQVVR